MKKITGLLTVLLLSAGVLSGCGYSQTETPVSLPSIDEVSSGAVISDESADTIRIGICQYGLDDSVTAIYSGFIEELEAAGYISGETAVIEYNIAETEEDCMYAADRLVNAGCDIIFAISEPAVRAVKNRTQEIPIIAAGVEDFEQSGFVSDNDAPGGNITGVSSYISEELQAELIRKLYPAAQNIMVLYSNNVTSRYLVSEFDEGCSANGLNAAFAVVDSAEEIRSTLLKYIENVDAVYCPADEIIFSNMADAAGVCNDNKIPFFCSSADMVTYGALAAYTADYSVIGKKSAFMVVSVLEEGKTVSSMPVEFLDADECYLNLNTTTADLIGYQIPAGGR